MPFVASYYRKASVYTRYAMDPPADFEGPWYLTDDRRVEKSLIQTDPREWHTLPFWDVFREELADLRDELVKWAHLFNLTDSWCLDRSVAFLFDDRFPKRWGYAGRPSRRRIEDDDWGFEFAPKLSGWQPVLESWKEAEDRLKGQFAEALQQHREMTLQSIEERGRVPIQQRVSTRHFVWTVLYQVERWTYSEIAAHYRIQSTKSVVDPVQQVAGMIGLKLRKPSPPGRPRGSKNRKPQIRG